MRSLITLGSPHLGAPLATAATMVGHTTAGDTAEKAVHALLPDVVDPLGTSITQLAEESEFMWRLNRRPLPAGVNVTSIGAREDLIVPAGVTRLDGARNVIVSSPGHFTEHSDMVRAPQTQREIALGLAGMEPTCQSLPDALADAAVPDVIRGVETSAGALLWAGGRLADRRLAKYSPTVPRKVN